MPVIPALIAVAAPLVASGIKNALTDKDAGQSKFVAKSYGDNAAFANGPTAGTTSPVATGMAGPAQPPPNPAMKPPTAIPGAPPMMGQMRSR